MLWILLFIIVLFFFLFISRKQKRNQKENTSTISAKSSKKLSTSTPVVDISIDNGFLSIWDIGFSGVCQQSANERYVVGCQDSDYKGGTRGGYRESGMGRAILIRDNKILWTKDFERPNTATVSNDGYVALNDWLFGDGLKGKFYLLNPAGEIILEDLFAANLNKLGITSDSKIAWTTTLASNNDDANSIMFYDVLNGKRLFKRENLYGELNKVNFNTDYLELFTDLGMFYQLNLNGEILNSEEVKKQIESHKLNSSEIWELNSLAKQKIKIFEKSEVDKKLAQKIIDKLENINTKNSSIDASSKAKVLRYIGELKLLLNKKEDALINFEKALELDENVGIKRRTKKLKDELN